MTDPNDHLGDSLLDGDRADMEIEMGESRLNRDAFIAAMAAYNDPVGNYDNIPGSVEAAIIAYLAAAPRPSPVSPEIEGLVERLTGRRWFVWQDGDPRFGQTGDYFPDQSPHEAADALTLLSEISTRQSADLDHAEKVRVEAEAEVERLTGQISEMKAAATHCGVNVEQRPVHILADLQRIRERAIAQRDLLSGEVERLKRERDSQYDENVNRIAAEGAALLQAEAAEAEAEKLRSILKRVLAWAAPIAGNKSDENAGLEEVASIEQAEALVNPSSQGAGG